MVRWCSLAVVFVCVILVFAIGSPAWARSAGPHGKSPLEATDGFAFTSAVSAAGSDGAPAVVMELEGKYVRPGRQDCTARISLGPTLQTSSRAVVVDPIVWIDDGDGLRRASREDFDWEDLCPSSADFWKGLDTQTFATLKGTPDTINGMATQRIDLTGVAGSAAALVSDVPAGVTFERVMIWRTRRSGMMVGADIKMAGSSAPTCAQMLGSSDTAVVPTSCSVTVTFQLSQVNDRRLEVDGPNRRK
jgi:hypothetical protein